MSIVVTGGRPTELRDGWFAVETLNPSTSTSRQSIAIHAPLTLLSTATGGTATATGFEINVFSLSTASVAEGEEKSIIMTGTGEAKIELTGTATGRWVLNEADDHLRFKMLGRRWRLVANSGATVATST